MSDDGEDFESINLASVQIASQPLSSLGTVPESSDDGLDPNDFLTQNHTDLDKDRNSSSNIGTEEPTANEDPHRSTSLSTSYLYESTLKESMSPSAIQTEEHSYNDMDNVWQTHQHDESLLQFLLDRQQEIKEEMKRDMSTHKCFISEGNDCREIRQLLGDHFVELSKNCYSLHELYGKESTSLRGLLHHLERWDIRRSRVLNRVKSIKSDDHSFGVKLAGLLHKRNDIDTEIDDLESRLRLLRANRAAVNSEIEEASSVLESKSAKYVNIFRELEKHGESVITNFLLSSGLPQDELQVLYKKVPVEALFKYKGANQKSSSEVVKARPAEEAAKREHGESPNAQNMGAQAYEVADGETQQVTEKSAYDRGYEKGNAQFVKVKETVSSMVHKIFNGKRDERASRNDVDDESNTITEKIDVNPITELLSQRIRALEDLSVSSSNLSAVLHQDGIIWSNIAASLNKREEKMLEVLSQSRSMPSEMESMLISCFDTLKAALDEWENKRKVGQPVYFESLVYCELNAVAHALDSLRNDTNYSNQVSSAQIILSDDDTASSNSTRPLSRFTMTHYGYHPRSTTIVDTVTENVNSTNSQKTKSSAIKATKDLKFE
ncbi:hypothetical_protein [Candidozyma auris]|uniref:hypothetical_protein n=1 Tax=Candidozyma auris TaxID=498019 RepID=UPI000D2987C1|nr:hypothetical_protein [[Candida] auris]QEO19419.1 hypothetical_protein [[Candida] auris]GBL50599.1 hypothetical protein CAJCM15448_28730 [[Candida] auris]